MTAHLSSPGLRLPVPGPAFGPYPERRLQAGASRPPVMYGLRGLHGLQGVQGLQGLQIWQGTLWTTLWAPRRNFVARVRQHQARWLALGSAPGSDHFNTQLQGLRAELGLVGLNGVALEQAFALVLNACEAVLGLQLYDTQLLAARILLDNRLAEMATGEGKTHAAMLAAATAALAGVPVHVVTANPYLAARDAAQLAPLYGALGLRVAAVSPSDGDEQRRAAWAADVTYTTARELIFDYLRDRQRVQSHPHPQPNPAGQPPLLRGLCMALIDEADSVLIDEARTPFILAEAHVDKAAQRRWRAALAAARRLREHEHFELRHDQPRATLNPVGVAACAADAGPTRDPLWCHDHHRVELVQTALAALYLYQADVHYLVTQGQGQGQVEIIDGTTGRVSPGRRWAAGLHQLIELKEGLEPSPVQRTTAQLSFQRFFPRYWRLCGTSGTLSEARRELARTYGLKVQAVPLRVANQRHVAGDYLFAQQRQRWTMVVRAVAMHHSAGRPVLVGCDSLADADTLCRLLQGQGLPHQRLDARQDAAEAACIAQAGQRGAITVATRLAGRGTDIRLAPGVAELGGLHVIDAQANGSARIDRQLHGRCARAGEPGLVLRLQALDAPLYTQELPALLLRLLQRWARSRRDHDLPGWLAQRLRRWVQARVQAREQRQRQALLQQDQDISRQLGFGGRIE